MLIACLWKTYFFSKQICKRSKMWSSIITACSSQCCVAGRILTHNILTSTGSWLQPPSLDILFFWLLWKEILYCLAIACSLLARWSPTADCISPEKTRSGCACCQLDKPCRACTYWTLSSGIKNGLMIVFTWALVELWWCQYLFVIMLHNLHKLHSPFFY